MDTRKRFVEYAESSFNYLIWRSLLSSAVPGARQSNFEAGLPLAGSDRVSFAGPG